MKTAKSFIHLSNGALHNFEVTYADPKVPFSSCATETFIVRNCKSLPNAVGRFDRAVPNHGAIKRVRKVEGR